MKRLTPACRLLLFSLLHKYKYFSRKDKLNLDGSFYYDDGRLAEELELSTKTIMRAKRLLKDIGWLTFQAGRFKSSATKYWILTKDDKKSLFRLNLKPDKISAKDDNSSSKASLNVIPNKEITNKINNTAGSASACPNSQASPAFSLEVYKGHTIETQAELEILLKRYGEELIVLIRKGEINLRKGIDVDATLNTIKSHKKKMS